MEVSSTSMNVARVTVRAMIQGLTAGRQASAWSSVAEAELIYEDSCRNSLTDPDFGFHRHAGAEFVVFISSRLEHNLDRNALHHFHVVASGIFGRQQAEAGAAGAGDAIDFTLVIASGRIYFDVDFLTDFHLTQLRLFKVGGNPDVFERNNLHQFLAGSDILPDLDGAVADHAIDGSNDFCVLQVQLRLIEIGLFALDIGFGGSGTGADDFHLPGRGAGVTITGLSIHQFALRLNHLLLCGVGVGTCGFHGRSAGFGRRGCRIELLLRNFLLAYELLVAAQVVLRFYVVGLCLLQLRLRGVELLSRRLDPGARAIDIRLRG